MEIRRIARIHTDFPEKFGIPRQSGLVPGARGQIVFEPEFRRDDALIGLKDYSHLWLIWDFSRAHHAKWSATVAPPRLGGRKKMGVFATRSPFRPNSLGLSSVRIESIEKDNLLGPVIHVSGVDMLDGTPIYDIKPYLPYADCHMDAVGGFGSQVVEHHLQVLFPEELLVRIEADDRESIIEILQQDPRTAFIHDPKRIWGVAYRCYNVRFTVTENLLTVCEVQNLR